MKVFSVQMIDLDLFSDISRDVAMATNFVKKWQTPTFVSLAFRNGMEYCYLNVCTNSINDASILCNNFVNFGPVTPELTELICERLVRHGQTRNSAIAEGPCNALVSRNSATTKYPYRVALFA